MHKIKTYFLIEATDNAVIYDIVKELQLNGTYKIDENMLEIGLCEGYDYDINIFVNRTLVELMDKIALLVKLKNKYNLTYYLSKTVEIDSLSEKVYPILGLSEEVIEFLYKTKTIDDLDYYII